MVTKLKRKIYSPLVSAATVAVTRVGPGLTSFLNTGHFKDYNCYGCVLLPHIFIVDRWDVREGSEVSTRAQSAFLNQSSIVGILWFLNLGHRRSERFVE